MVDTHCHLNDSEAFPAPAVAIEDARGAGVHRMIVVGVDLASSRAAVGIAEEFDGVFACVGWHPNCAQTFTESAFAQVQELVQHPKVVAVGEMGLDFHWDFATREQQEDCLIAQLEWAASTRLPVVLHCREAYPELLEILENRAFGLRFVFHCFSGDRSDAQRGIELGGWFGVDGPITYKKAEVLREIVRTLPREKLLIETDSPWLTPHPHRGKRNTPAYLPLVAEGLAATLDLSLDEVDALTTKNAEMLFAL